MDPDDAEALVSLITELATHLQLVAPEEADSLAQPGLVPPFRSWDRKRSALRRLFQQKSALETTLARAQKDDNPAVAVAAMAQLSLGFKNKDASPDSGGSGGTDDREKVTFDQKSEGGEKNEEGGREGAGEMGTSEEGEGPQVILDMPICWNPRTELFFVWKWLWRRLEQGFCTLVVVGCFRS